MAWWSWLLLIGEWVIRIVMLVVVARKRRPNSAVAWLLIIFFEPLIGLVLYLLIGENRLPRRRMAEYKRIIEAAEHIRGRFRGHPRIVQPKVEERFRATITMAEKLGNMPILGGNRVELIGLDDDFVDRLVGDIDEAKDHVHLLYYIFGRDDVGERVGQALVRAVKRGVACRVLMDGVGSRKTLKQFGPGLRQMGVEVHAALPVGVFRRSVARFDLRNHRKVAVIDGSIGYTGSHNLINASYGRPNLAWVDLSVRVQGPAVLNLQSVFMSDWRFETRHALDEERYFPAVQACGNVAIQVFPSGPIGRIEIYQRLIVSALHAAQRHVVITTPYFVPDEAFLQAIQTAVLRDVIVEIIVPERFDQLWVGAASQAYFEELLEAGVRVHRYQKGLLHAKTMCVDDAIAFIGSSNFDIRSFALNFEINSVVFDPAVVESLRQELAHYLSDSRILERAAWAKRPLRRKAFHQLAKLMSPVL